MTLHPGLVSPAQQQEKLSKLGTAPPPRVNVCSPVLPTGNEMVLEKFPKVVTNWFAMLLKTSTH